MMGFDLCINTSISRWNTLFPARVTLLKLSCRLVKSTPSPLDLSIQISYFAHTKWFQAVWNITYPADHYIFPPIQQTWWRKSFIGINYCFMEFWIVIWLKNLPDQHTSVHKGWPLLWALPNPHTFWAMDWLGYHLMDLAIAMYAYWRFKFQNWSAVAKAMRGQSEVFFSVLFKWSLPLNP